MGELRFAVRSNRSSRKRFRAGSYQQGGPYASGRGGLAAQTPLPEPQSTDAATVQGHTVATVQGYAVHG